MDRYVDEFDEIQLDTEYTTQYVWSAAYVDAMVLRDSDENGRQYVMHDANFNVTGLMNTSGTVQERFGYDPYGQPTVLTGNWQLTTDNYAWLYLHQGGRYDTISGLRRAAAA